MRPLVFFLLFFCAAALANMPGYDLSLGAEVRGGTLKVAPVVTAPAGAKLRYDVTTTRTGRSGNSNSRQSGNVTVGDDGKASLSQVAVSVSEQDRYEVHVEVYEGGRLVASETLKHPQ
ncbi:MAG TPA: curli-like amyloid fiber formation chaperone CsgH [Xanthomonadaceae bacterium]|nr:curli-like amyloid fiber formation chaperone CsgH [Xanthomonadaceae bacterium]